jgi:hypothetical protein
MVSRRLFAAICGARRVPAQADGWPTDRQCGHAPGPAKVVKSAVAASLLTGGDTQAPGKLPEPATGYKNR